MDIQVSREEDSLLFVSDSDLKISVERQNIPGVLFVDIGLISGNTEKYVFCCDIKPTPDELSYAVDDEYINVWAGDQNHGIQIKLDEEGIVVDKTIPSNGTEDIEALGYVLYSELLETEE